MQGSAARRLIWVPIIHTQEDLGGLGETVRHLYAQVGPRKWRDHQRAVDQIWANICVELEKLAVDYSKVRVYQDGLPCCGHEEEIVRDLARTRSRNYQIVLELMAKGARIMGTESAELLVEEYELSRQALQAACSGREPTAAQREASDHTLERRDRYIAERIGQTLLPGETGLLFLGLLHSLDGLLAADIEVTKLNPAPLASRGNAGRHEMKEP